KKIISQKIRTNIQKLTFLLFKVPSKQVKKNERIKLAMLDEGVDQSSMNFKREKEIENV
ncbi:MAG: hypothetical protein EZS28_049831, partial [Streblomastix strix]